VATPRVVGTYYLQSNQKGGGAHVANCGYATLAQARGRGVARAMCIYSMETARQQGYLAMQFNFVVATNEGAVALWKSLGFEVVGRVPQAFRHPALGLVDALVMYRAL
jgi:ribosomal protein S18 acetylase RimI-like enzyme